MTTMGTWPARERPRERLLELGPGALARLPGVGEAKAARILAALELGVRVVERRSRPTIRRRFTCSSDVYDAFHARLGLLRHEVFMVLGLNNRNEVIRDLVVAQGSINECHIRPREVFRPLIAEAAARAILLHNHPSGDPSPSPQDVAVTRRLAEAGQMLGIPVLDHVVICCATHSSLRDLGLMSDDQIEM